MLSIKEWYKLFPEYENNRFWISGESYCGMYIPLLADQLLKNKDNILESGAPLNFTGIMIGNGVMLTELHWRRKARNTFYSRHYHIGPEIQNLISHCEYTDADANNFLCTLGNKLVDQVFYVLFSKLEESTLTILLEFAMLEGPMIVSGTLPSTKECTPMMNSMMMTHLAPQMILDLSSSSMTQKYKNNLMFLQQSGLLAAVILAVTSRRIEQQFPSLRALGMLDSRSCFFQEMLMPKFLMWKLRNTSDRWVGKWSKKSVV